MEKYKLNDRYVRMASNYILDFIIRDNNIILDDKSRRKIIREINTAIRCIKIDDLTKEKNRVGAIFHPENVRQTKCVCAEPKNAFFDRLVQQRKRRRH